MALTTAGTVLDPRSSRSRRPLFRTSSRRSSPAPSSRRGPSPRAVDELLLGRRLGAPDGQRCSLAMVDSRRGFRREGEVFGVCECLGDQVDDVIVEESVDDGSTLAFGGDKPEVAKMAQLV